MTATTSLNLLAVLKSAASKSGMEAQARAISGLTAPAKAMFIATQAHTMPRGTVLVVVPADRDIDEVVTDVRFFLSALEGLAPGAAEDAVLPFPSHEVDPYRGMTPHFGVVSSRARALYALTTQAVRVVVASGPALAPRVSAPARMKGAGIDLQSGHDIAPSDLAALLTDAGFTREDPADEHGEFALRGGILDLFPANETQPIRLEFLGDTIETMRRYDAASQRSQAAVDRLTVVPLLDRLGDDRSATIFDYLAQARESRIFVSEADEVETGIAKLLAQVVRSYEAASGSATNEATDEEEERDEAVYDEWSRLSAEDDPEDRAVVQSPPARRRRATADTRNRTALLAPDVLFLEHGNLTARLASAVSLSELGIESSGGASALGGQPVARVLRSQPVVEMHGRLPEWVTELKRIKDAGEQALFVAVTPGRAERTIELLKEYDVFAASIDRAEDARYASVLVTTGLLSRGFRLPDAGLHLFAECDVFDEDRQASAARSKARNNKAFLSDLRDLKAGDLIVHVEHGIGVFVGLKQIGLGPSTGPGQGSDDRQEFLELRYAGDDKLFVPVERLDLVQKYTGATRPPIDRLGGTSWEKAKTKVKKAMRDMAGELLKLYATRKAVAGYAFGADSHWQREFEDAFPYELTPDQKSAVTDIKNDMQSPTPMDRLLCGDVGYGKTEVAMRAAFKAVMEGKQVAILVPTTVLAFQHEKTLRERFAGFPVRIAMVSRFRGQAEQKEALADLAVGKLDIIVGTHRLLSKDVEFRDLGLLVVDEEQRFGVGHKEKIKQMKRKVDVLTMSATPIPRTLNMSLVGIRDMSIIETPPRDRLSIQTNVVKFDQQVIGRAIGNELERGGQIFFVHNRVDSIFSIADLLRRLVPEARIVVGHGQMAEDTLERAMLDFVARKFDILVATTIIENGLDIPNANTIIINRADRYGLSQLYQLRGRVGRSDRPAYAHLLIPPEDNLSPVAKKRLAAIKEFSDLGSGFRVAALDLEIRGAGNLLGGEQSGHIESVGFEMYMKLLEETIRELSGQEIDDDVRATVNLKVDFRIDESYVADMNQRLMLYRKVASARREEEIDQVLEEAIDRYGPLPTTLLNLADYGRIRVMSDRLGVESIDREGRTVVIRFRPQTKLDPIRLVSLVKGRSELALMPPSGLRLNLADSGGQPSAMAESSAPRPVVRGPSAEARAPGKLPKKPAVAPSWWTARARTGEVTAGFTKNAILQPTKDDPRAEGGLFEKVGGLLSDLVDAL
ncbi:MAG: transcription-repair coupling factor [Vicinamibacterales bacterium]